MIINQIFRKILRSKATTLSRIILPLFSAVFLVWISALLLFTSCSTSRHIQAQLVEKVSKDTIYLATEKYDSIYITQDRYIDRSRDTLYIKESNTEYRYKLLRDTIKEVRVDSIPYEVRITETIEVPRKLTWYDHLTRASFWLLTGFTLLCLYRRFHKL